MPKVAGSVKIIKGARLIDGTGAAPIERAAVVVDGERIKAVGRQSEIPIPPGAEVIEMTGCTLMPGLIDTHLHLTQPNVLTFKNYRAAVFEVPPQLQMLYALLHAQMCMETGFTTLRDLGGIGYAGLVTEEMIALRDAINTGIVAGPRLKVAGWAIITSAHLDLGLPRNAIRAPGVTADGPWELRKMARAQLRLGCDLIKTAASGGAGTDKEEPTVKNMTQEELDAVADEAHAFGKLCSCHCFTPESQCRAVKAGVDTIEHCVFTNDEALAMMKTAGTIVVPTLAHRSDRAIEIRRRTGASEFVLQKMKRLQPDTKETFQRMHAAGITIAMGTDTQIDPEMGGNSLELEIYVDYGMTPLEAIQTATQNAAAAVGMAKHLGTLEPSKYADILAVDGDPLGDIRILQNRQKMKLVMKAGYIYVDKREGHTKGVVFDSDWGWDLIV